MSDDKCEKLEETSEEKLGEKLEEKRSSSQRTAVTLVLAILLPVSISYCVVYYRADYCKEQVSNPYREACLSGKYSALKDLHPFISDTIETVEGELSREDFLNHIWKGRPVLMKGAAKHWKSYREWSDKVLSERLHDVKFYVDLRKHHLTGESVRRRMSLGTFIKSYKEKEWYLDSMSGDYRLLDELDLPSYFNVSGIFEANKNDTYQTALQYNFYLSSGNTNSPLHYDGYDNLMTVLDGRKEWIIGYMTENKKVTFGKEEVTAQLNVTDFNISNHLPLCDIKWYRAIVEKGDTLYVPILWLHHVYSPPSRNMGVGMWFNHQAYESLLRSMFDAEDTAEVVDQVERYVATRKHPCQLTSCGYLPPGNLSSLLPKGFRETYSRESDIPLRKTYVLNNGQVVRAIAFGTGFKRGSISDVYNTTLSALNMGYRFVDTAEYYGNEQEVGKAVMDCKWVREYVTVLTKFTLSEMLERGVTDIYTAVTQAVERSISLLGTGYIDIMLIHDTDENTHHQILEAWKALEDMVAANKIKSIGLSNTDLPSLQHITSNARVNVSLVQNLFSPLYYDKEVYTYCAENHITFMTYGVSGDYFKVTMKGLVENPVTTDALIREIADKYHTTPHGVLYYWAAQKDVVVTMRSTNIQHLLENLNYTDLMLSPSHIRQIDQRFAEKAPHIIGVEL